MFGEKIITNERLFGVLLTIAFSFLAIYVVRLFNPFLDYDEAGQFFISHGLNHYTPPLSANGNLTDVLDNNANYNLDPGGFSIILHFWIKVSNHYLWLRLFPFIFYLLTFLYVFRLCVLLTQDKVFATAATVFAICYMGADTLFMYGCYLRPYSISVFFAILFVYRTLSCKDYSVRRFIIDGFIAALGVTLRYSLIPLLFICMLYTTYQCYKNNKLSPKLIVSLYILPVISVCLVYFFSMKYQTGGSMISDTYSNAFLCNNISKILTVCGFSFLASLISIPYIRKNYTRIFSLTMIFVFLQSFFVVASFLNFFPYGTRHMSAVCSLSIIYDLMLVYVLWDKVIHLRLFLLFMLVVPYSILYVHRQHLPVGLEKADLKLSDFYGAEPYKDDVVLVGEGENASFRYLLEYGCLKNGSYLYPKQMLFVKGPKHSSKNVRKNRENDLSEYKQKIKQATFLIGEPKLFKEDFEPVGGTCYRRKDAI